MSLCNNCQEIPVGIAGHDGLFASRSRTGRDPLFKCSACGAAWRRRYLGGGTFTWHLAKAARAAKTHVALGPHNLRTVKALMARHIGTRLTIDDMATAVNMSPFHFSRCFKVETGASPHQYLRRMRLARARDMVARTTLSMGEIGRLVGFRWAGEFTTAFAKEFGTTPLQYRIAARRDNPANARGAASKGRAASTNAR